jgi:TfuA protein
LNQKIVVVFIGPSLPSDDAKKILIADYHPPVARGDITTLLRDPPHIIGIIDGVFHQQPAVSHREILQALEAGVIVVGGASMGALRGAELDREGMKGIGTVYQYYKDGIIESDDDVAIVFDPETYEQLSDPLVSMRYNFQMAEHDGLISHEDFLTLYNTAKAIFYPQRTYSKVFLESGLDQTKIDSLQSFLNHKGLDIKTEDAKAVLEYIKNLLED